MKSHLLRIHCYPVKQNMLDAVLSRTPNTLRYTAPIEIKIMLDGNAQFGMECRRELAVLYETYHKYNSCSQ